ncbi:hypothetical protein [Actinokineospora cianjurensis]|uniref:Uncharacterized protein n=1 Tax=Actinokineospora cianjurensis TaxID=585224 RepID=A0A421B738_9PSEU|nr:hypothetical protein [Actinokineospora cianjurensis]RLK60316.1 hypothetical protein CLV68_0818 [Actinokineospora cianjurensis]
MGKARRNKRDGRGQAAKARVSSAIKSDVSNERDAADAALARLCRRAGAARQSLAEAYALGYGSLVIHQIEDTTPDWIHDTNPLDLIILGMTFGKNFRNGYEFSNTRAAWLQQLRSTTHWSDIEKFVSVAMDLSRDTGLALDSGELLYTLANHLEDAGLNRRRLPASLRPEALLANARFACGPSTDFELPEATAESVLLAEEYLADLSADIDLPDSYATTLRDALWLFDRAGAPTDTDPMVLLVVLYTGVAAYQVDDLLDLVEPAEAWALSFDYSSPLSRVLDTILVASAESLTTVDTLARLLTLPEFLEPVDMATRSWNRSPGPEMTEIALSLGYTRAIFTDYKTVALSPIMAAQLRRAKDSFEHPPAPGDLIFGVDPELAKQGTVNALHSFEVHPAIISAFETEDLLPASLDSFHTAGDRRAWQEAVDRYVSTNPDTEVPDLDAEFGKMKALSNILLVRSIVDDPELATEVITLIDDATASTTDELVDLADFLEAQASHLDEFGKTAETRAQTIEMARSWGGEVLVRRVLRWMDGEPTIHLGTDPVALLVAAAVWIGSMTSDEH